MDIVECHPLSRRKETITQMISIRTIGFAWIAFGVLVLVFSRFIVFPGLEVMLGIDTLVGRENVNYQPDGSYVYTNPGAMAAWILSVSGLGLLIAAVGSAMVFRSSKRAR